MQYLGKLFYICLAFFTFIPTTYALDTYTLDPQHTYVLWHINHFGFSNPSGKWLAEGQLVLDPKNPKNSKVTATINVANIITGIPELDKHLKGKLFFNVEQFPKATFVSDSIVLENPQAASVSGNLIIHGISKPITLAVKLNKIGINPINNKETVGFSASTALKRSDFGINTLLPGLSDEVKIDIEAEAFKP